MTDITSAADSMAASEEPKVPTMDEAKALADSGKAENTTPEEVAKVLKSSGFKLAEPVKASDEKDTKPEAAKEDAKAGEADTDESDAAVETADETEDADAVAQKPVTAPDTAIPEFSFEVQDAEGNAVKIVAGDNLEETLKDFTPRSNGQIIQILKELGRVEAEKANYEADQVKAADAADQAERVSAIRAGWDEEIKALQADKRIPLTAKGADNERVAEVFKFMSEENNKRIAANKPTIGSFEDALDKLENIEARNGKVEAEKQEKETARKNGALVGGSSAPATSGGPVYKAGSARNANEAIRAMGLIK